MQTACDPVIHATGRRFGGLLLALTLSLPLSGLAAPGAGGAECGASVSNPVSNRPDAGGCAMHPVRGHVVQTRRADTRSGTQHLLALVESERGGHLTVDLGEADAFGRDLPPGTEIAVRGRQTEHAGRTLLVAERVRIDGQTLRIDRPRQRPASLSGEVLRLKQVSVRGSSTRNRIALVQSEREDRQRVVDLGPVSGTAADVSVGDRIRARGRVVSMRGQPILLASEVERDGERLRVERPDARRTRQAAAPREADEPRAEIRTQNGIRYVSGGIGNASQQRMRELADRFPLRVTLATRSGAYVGRTALRIEDVQRNTLIDVITQGPILLADLPPGTYQVVATPPDGPTESRRVQIREGASQNVVLRLGALEEDAG